MSNTQALAVVQGVRGQQKAVNVLQRAGFEIVREKYNLELVEIDIWSRNKEGVDFFWEVKYGYRMKRPGLLRTGTCISGSREKICCWRCLKESAVSYTNKPTQVNLAFVFNKWHVKDLATAKYYPCYSFTPRQSGAIHFTFHRGMNDKLWGIMPKGKIQCTATPYEKYYSVAGGSGHHNVAYRRNKALRRLR